MTSKKRTPDRSLGTIASALNFTPRYVRSLEIERDMADERAVEGYVFTPAVLFAAQSLAMGLRASSTQRAWRVTGPYGAGKSAFGLFLIHAASRSRAGKQLLKRLEQEAGGLHRVLAQLPRYLPIPLTGTRMPFGAALVSRLLLAVQSIKSQRPSKLLSELARLNRKAQTQPLTDDEAVGALRSFVSYATAGNPNGYDGVLLVVDEMGKFLEYAALRPDQADAHLFQRVAELASGSSTVPLAVVGFLHQNFAEYAAGYWERGQEEWSKVAQRFEDIPFDESLEQYSFLLARAMEYGDGVLRRYGIDRVAKSLYATTLGNESDPAVRAKVLLDAAEKLYPLHPTTFFALASAVKRFGQNQRSLFSFVLSSEPHGLQQYIQKTELAVQHWYRLPELFDYLSNLDGLSFRQADRERKWEALKDTLAEGPVLDELEQRLVKTVGLLNVLEPVQQLRADARLLSVALYDVEHHAAIDDALKRLVDKKVLYRRAANADYCIWKHSSVDVEALRTNAAKVVRPVTSLDDLLHSIESGRSVIAHRHYQQTGTLRAFNVRCVSLAQYEAATKELESDYDGEILVVLLEPGTHVPEAVTRALRRSLASNPLRVLAFRRIEAATLQAAHRIRVWQHVDETCLELRVDDFARREVRQQLSEARRQLDEQLSRVVGLVGSGEENATWCYGGKLVEITSRRALSRLLSDICDTAYAYAPKINNELINRHKLTSAISLARQRLVTAMIESSDLDGLGFAQFPPEKTIYLSLLRETKIHRAEHGRFGFYPPKLESDQYGCLPVWNAIDAYLTEHGKVSVDRIFALLRVAPYGLREGPALLFLLAYVLFQRRNLAVFERETYIVDLTDDHVLRLSKSPTNFALHLHEQVGGVSGLGRAYEKALEAIRQATDSLSDAHGIVNCVYRWYSRLSPFSLQTNRLTGRAREVRALLKRASDPIELITTALPAACGYANLAARSKRSLVEEFSETLRKIVEEIDTAEATLRKELLSILASAFGSGASVAQLRNHIQSNFGPYTEILGDAKLKTLLNRALDQDQDESAWLDSMAAVLGERTLALWTDDTLGKFRAEAMAFAGQLKRWAALMLEHRDKKVVAGSLVRVQVTAASGAEHTLVVSKGSPVTADELKSKIREIISLNPNEAPLALAEALAELLGEANTSVRKRKSHGK